MADSDTKLNSLKSEIRSLLVSCPVGMSIQSFLNDYMECIGRPLPFVEFGFKSAIGFFNSLTDVLKVKETSNGTLLLPIESKNSSHINKMVSKQRNVKKRRRSRYARSKTIMQGNRTYHQTVRSRTNMHFDTSMYQDSFESDELDHLDIVWAEDVSSEKDDLIYGKKVNNRPCRPSTIINLQRNESSDSSFIFSSDKETDYEEAFKQSKNSTLIKKPSLVSYDSSDCNQSSANEENTLKSLPTFSASSALNHDLIESTASYAEKKSSIKFDNCTNFKLFSPTKCDVTENRSLPFSLKQNHKSNFHPALRRSSAFHFDDSFNKGTHLADTDTVKNDTFRNPSPVDNDFTETKSRNTDKFAQSDSSLQQPMSYQYDSFENKPTLGVKKQNMKSDFTENIHRSSSPIMYDWHETNNSSPKHTGKAVKSNCHGVLKSSILFPHDPSERTTTLKRSSPIDKDFNETKSPFEYPVETEADSAFRRPSTNNSKFHSSTSFDINKSECPGPNPVDYDYKGIKSLDYTEEADSAFRRPSTNNSKFHSSTSYDINKSDCPGPNPVDYDYKGIKSLDYTEEADSLFIRPRNNNSKLHSSTSFDGINKSESQPTYRQGHFALSRSSLDGNDSTSHNPPSSDVYVGKSSNPFVEKKEERNCKIEVSEDHEVYLWALVNGIVLDEKKIVEPYSRLINLTKNSNVNFTKKELETITSLVDTNMFDRLSADTSDNDHSQISENSYESNRNDAKEKFHFLTDKKNIYVNCESKVNRCVCSERNRQLKNEVKNCVCSKYTRPLALRRDSEMNTCDCSKYNKSLSNKKKISGLNRGMLFEDTLIESEKRLGLNDNNPLVNLNVGRGVAMKNLLQIYKNHKVSADIGRGRGYFLKYKQSI